MESNAPAPIGDLELRASLQRGDPAAANSLCVRVGPRVHGTVLRLLGPRDPDREDVMQQALVAIVDQIGGYRGEGSLGGWASGVAAKTVYKHLRRRQLERRTFVADGDEHAGAQAQGSQLSPLARVSARDQLERAFSVLTALDHDKTFAYLLHDVCGFDLREIAGILEISLSAAQTRLVRGRKLVQEELAKHPDLLPDGVGHD